MKSKKARREFENYLRRSGDRGAPKAPAPGFTRMLDFYRSTRFEDVNLNEHGDMLLFQWGTYDWGHGPHFEIAPADGLHELGKGERWCSLPAALPGFETFVIEHPALKAVGSREDGQVSIEYECVG